MGEISIEVKNLQKKFGQQLVLDGIDLTVSKGEIFALLGPNGAGKTTIINILSTLVAPDGGSAYVAGYDVVRNKEEVQNAISLTGQFAAVDEMLTAEENLKMMGRLSGLSRVESQLRTKELLEYFDLIKVARNRVKTYSGGMRRRLDLAVSLVVHKPIIFLDEPTTGLDTRSRRALWDTILQLASEGVTVFLTTQYLEEADQLADTIAVISKGKIVAHGTPEEMKARIGNETIELRNEQDEIIHEIPTKGNVLEVKQILEELTSSIPQGTRVSIRKPSLDDVFISLTSEKERV
ncbi:ATP-binding cassette domain-containing protein [Bacillus sp. FJAT-49736]|uniref:ATP-binding cassette domain-containing protein n=1 Tax=Bacillus sp. FJAT-49736 TaxID=2833582 RepID=UPI001BCA0ECA|nr:ATP-binding cassette domain-containing protein [Bacillus sp. FJAT-49736]MBS4175276.1 ATP-binding cassette domain-containing protein [Bacillus sp. FJAT-49736]